MENAGKILVGSSVVIMFASWVAASYKTGFSYSPQSSLKKDQVKYEVDKTKVTKFFGAVFFAFSLNILYCLIFTNELGAVLLFSLLNMSLITYCLVYWILLKEKHSTRK